MGDLYSNVAGEISPKWGFIRYCTAPNRTTSASITPRNRGYPLVRDFRRPRYRRYLRYCLKGKRKKRTASMPRFRYILFTVVYKFAHAITPNIRKVRIIVGKATFRTTFRNIFIMQKNFFHAPSLFSSGKSDTTFPPFICGHRFIKLSKVPLKISQFGRPFIPSPSKYGQHSQSSNVSFILPYSSPSSVSSSSFSSISSSTSTSRRRYSKRLL